MGIVNVLSSQMANLIAAGEVVERPGSVVKEIVENSIDAGSRHIEVEIKNGGITYIRISDDGSGIDKDDIEKVFLRHATSKIKEPADMVRIATMGFRGEALAAISAVSKVELFTRTALGIGGISITCEGGVQGKPVESGGPKGTNIVIRDLFYNVPARMKFLKKDATEGSYCESAVISAALAHPEISFKFIKDGKESFFSSGNGSMLQVINSICGREVTKELLPVRGSFPDAEITGYVSGLSTTRSSRSMQYFLVNGRPVRGKILSAAVDSAYKGKIMPGRHPLVFLAVKLPHSAVDVNVHPAKLEVKFAREKEVFSAIHNTISMALEANDGFPELKIEPAAVSVAKEDNLTGFQQQITVQKTPDGHIVMDEGSFGRHQQVASPGREIKVEGRQEPASSELDFDESMFHINKMELVPPRPSVTKVGQAVSVKYQNSGDGLPLKMEADTAPETASAAPDKEQGLADEIKVIGQVFNTYIIAQQGDGMWLIDKHAAHERIIYNKLVLNAGAQDMQMLMQPMAVSLTAAEKQACLENLPLIEKSGFELEDYGLSGLSVRSAPTYLEQEDIPFVLTDMAAKLIGGFQAGSVIFDELLKSISCKAAVKGGSYSGIEEMQRLAQQVLTQPDIKNCPHGRPVAVFMTRYQMEKQFKRVL